MKGLRPLLLIGKPRRDNYTFSDEQNEVGRPELMPEKPPYVRRMFQSNLITRINRPMEPILETVGYNFHNDALGTTIDFILGGRLFDNGSEGPGVFQEAILLQGGKQETRIKLRDQAKEDGYIVAGSNDLWILTMARSKPNVFFNFNVAYGGIWTPSIVPEEKLPNAAAYLGVKWREALEPDRPDDRYDVFDVIR